MVNKIDIERLDVHIGELNSLRSEWRSYSKKATDLGENSGRSVNQMIEIATSLQSLQDGFVALLNNTIFYMNQRKQSVESKENKATEEVRK